MPPTSALPLWLAGAIDSLAAGDVNGWMSIYAPDAVHEFPWAPEGRTRQLEGREAIAAYMSKLVNEGRFRFGSLSDIRSREAGDEIIVEAEGHHHLKADGAPVNLSYIWFITVRDGQVARFRDYMNPLQLSAR
jgi:ketosteroid isomerase-like protein